MARNLSRILRGPPSEGFAPADSPHSAFPPRSWIVRAVFASEPNLADKPRDNAPDIAAALSPSGLPPQTGWDNGYYVKSSKRNLFLKIGGIVQLDYRLFEETVTPQGVSHFTLRSARLLIEGTLFKALDFRVMPEFAVKGHVIIRDAYGDLKLAVIRVSRR